MKFVVIEDDRAVQEIIRKIIRKLSVKYNEDFEIIFFEKYSSELEEEMKETSIPKIYILDIELSHSICGIEIAEKIRKTDWDSEIIFVTNHDKMFEVVHRRVLKVFDFIEKFRDMSHRLYDDLVKIMNHKYDEKVFTFQHNHVVNRIYMKHILYITRDKEDRKAVIYTDTPGVTLKINLTLTELKNMLDSRFVQTHKSCLANKERMIERNYTKGYFILDTGEQVDLLSKNYREEIEEETIKE